MWKEVGYYNGGYLAVGAMLTVLGIGIAFYQYNRKDIA